MHLLLVAKQEPTFLPFNRKQKQPTPITYSARCGPSSSPTDVGISNIFTPVIGTVFISEESYFCLLQPHREFISCREQKRSSKIHDPLESLMGLFCAFSVTQEGWPILTTSFCSSPPSCQAVSISAHFFIPVRQADGPNGVT